MQGQWVSFEKLKGKAGTEWWGVCGKQYDYANSLLQRDVSCMF